MKKTFVSVLAAASAFTFSNCANPYGPGASTTQRDTATGALIGAGAGAIIGNQSGRAIEGALLGAGAGAIGGNVIGRSREN